MANITAWEKANIMCFLLEEHSSLAKKKKKEKETKQSNQRDLPGGPLATNPTYKARGESSIPGWEQRSHTLQGN